MKENNFYQILIFIMFICIIILIFSRESDFITNNINIPINTNITIGDFYINNKTCECYNNNPYYFLSKYEVKK